MTGRWAVVIGMAAVGVMALGAQTATAADGGRKLGADLSGEGVVGTIPGDDFATGTASFVLNQGQGTFCWTLSLNLEGASVQTIRIAPTPDGDGLGPPIDGGPGCVPDLTTAYIMDVRQDPADYTVTVVLVRRDAAGRPVISLIQGQLHK